MWVKKESVTIFIVMRKTQFDAWNIDPNYHSKPIAFPSVDTIIIEEDGPIRSTLLIKYLPTAAHSTIHTRISLYINDPKIFGESIIDWQEEWKILKIGVDTIFDSETITCGIPFGCQQRSTKTQNRSGKKRKLNMHISNSHIGNPYCP